MRVLIVDDEADFLEVISTRIDSWGYKVITVTNGRDALKEIENKNADLVILDYMMPDMDGVATLKGIRRINKNIPVIMFTAYPDKRSIEGAQELGASVLIPKLTFYHDDNAALRSTIDALSNKLSKKEEGLF